MRCASIATRTLLAIALLTAAPSLAAGQARGYDELSPAQRRLLRTWGADAPSPEGRERQARDRFDSAPERFRVAFEQITGHLAAVLLSDPENGEVLGAAIDLIDAVEPPERPPVGTGAGLETLSVALFSGARDRLRRSAEFERLVGGSEGGQTVFEHTGPPVIRIVIAPSGARADVSLSRR